MKQKIILASGSPRRKQLLEGLGLPVEVCVSAVEETVEGNPPPHLYVQQLALLKGAAVAKNIKKGLVLSADTIVWFRNKVLGKPENQEDARRMLWAMSGKTHSVFTGICVIDAKTGKSITDYEETTVTFRTLTEEEIYRYVETGEPMDKAGAYGIQGIGSLLVDGIAGDYFNVVGLPLNKLYLVLKEEFEINIL